MRARARGLLGAGAMLVGAAGATGLVLAAPSTPAFAQSGPTVTAISPAAGPIGGDTTVTVTGTGFGTTSGSTFTSSVTAVDIGSTALTTSEYDVLSPTQIDLATPAVTSVPATPQDITVTTSSGTSATSSADQFTYYSGSLPSCEASLTATNNICFTSTTGTLTITPSSGSGLTFSGFGLDYLGSYDSTTGDVTIPADQAVLPQVSGTLDGITAAADFAANGSFTGSLDVASGAVSTTGTLSVGLYVPATGQVCVYQQPLQASGTVGTFTSTSPDVLSATGTLTSSGPLPVSNNDGANGCTILGLVLGGATMSASLPVTAYLYSPPAAPVVTSISPTSGVDNAPNTVTIDGSGFTGASAVDFGSYPASSYTVVSDSEITATVPAEAGVTSMVDTTVTANGQTSATSPADEYTFTAPTSTCTVAVSSISPNDGPTEGGTDVTIEGTDLSDATAVTFGSAGPAPFEVNADGSLTASSPTATFTTDTTVDVQVSTSTTCTSPVTTADEFTYIPGPTITSVNPDSGPAAGGTTVTINGVDLGSAVAVDFGPEPAQSFAQVSGTEITAVSPPGAAGDTEDIVVATLNGISSPNPAVDDFTWAAAPTITSVTPDSGPAAGGNTVTIAGTGFTATGNTVTFGTADATGVTANSAGTSLTATVPAGAPAGGTVNVTVTNANGSSNTEPYTYVPAPTLTGISPSSGVAAGGTTVTLTGTNLTGASVSFGAAGAAGTPTVNSAGTSLTVTSPAYATGGDVQVSVTTTGGTGNTETYDYLLPPSITSITPNNGSYAGGNTVTIAGANLTGASVAFGSVGAGSSVSVSSAGTSLTVVVPADAAAETTAATVNVSVTTPGGASGTLSYTYNPIPAPSITSITPNNGSYAGGNTVTIAGANLTGASVAFGSVGAGSSVSVNSAGTSLTVVVPADAAAKNSTTTVEVTVTTTGGTSNTEPYTYNAIPVPSITSITPNNGSYAGGNTVTIAGANLTGASVAFGSVGAGSSVSVSSAGTSLTVVVPADAAAKTAAATVNVSVTTPGGTSNTEPYTYNPVPAPTITSISPTSGPATGGTTVTIDGTGLTGATVAFGSVGAGTSVAVNSAGTSLTVVAPADTAVTTTAATVSVTVTTSAGTSNGESYTYNPVSAATVPAVTELFPSSGATQGYSLVWVFGKNFTKVTKVTFGGNTALFQTYSSNLLLALSPPASSGGTVDVQVTNASGTSAVVSADKYTYIKETCILFICFG